MEILRVNNNSGQPTITPKHKLQNKANRYYFKDAFVLNKKQIFVSPLDLNIENGKVEIPYKPMIRIGTPVFNELGIKHGIILLNYYGKDLLKKLKAYTNEHIHLLNRDGFWLLSPYPKDEWGFMLNKDTNISKRYPSSWKKILNKQNDQFYDEIGLWTFETIYPIQIGITSSSGSEKAYDASSKTFTHKEYFWKLLSLSPIAEVEQLNIQAFNKIGLFIIGLLLVGVLGSAYIAFITLKHEESDVKSHTLLEREQLLQSMSEGIYAIDLNGECTFINNACLNLLGYESKNELLGKNMHNTIHHHYKDGTVYPVEQCHIFKAFQLGKGTSIDYEVLWRKDGSAFYAEYHSFPIFEESKCMGAVVSFTDITQRKLTEKKLFQSEEKYRLAMNATQDGLWDWDIKSDKVYYSPGWLRILELDETEGNYNTWQKRISTEDESRILETLQEHLIGNTEIWQEEHRLHKSDGNLIWVLGRGQVVKRDKDGKPLRMIGTMTDISTQKNHERTIQTQANYDSLTLLPNRKLFHELLDKEIKQAKRDREQVWILFMDLDGFKEINDTFGHKKGDQLLVMVSKRIQSIVRQADMAARLGGDEFVIILHNVHEPSDVDRLASNLIETIGKKYILGKNELYITLSIGIANYPTDAENSDDLLKYADQSMYEAKKKGKNQYTYFTPDLQYASLLRMQIASDIHNALEKDEFELYYQPIIKLDTGKIHKAEALIRWNHPEKGLISPNGFIHIAEESSVICDIGMWVFEQVCKQLKIWKSLISTDFQISINMSPLQLKTKEKKYQFWINAVNNVFFSGKNIVLEITEGVLVKNEPNVNKKLLEFRDAGIQVAIDDFGTGYSSLSYLKEFDIDYLKVDQSFICNLEVGSREESLSEAIVVMAHKLDLKVIAEGIETKKQHELLKLMGCDYGQGYLFSKPLPSAEFERKYLSTNVSDHININST